MIIFKLKVILTEITESHAASKNGPKIAYQAVIFNMAG